MRRATLFAAVGTLLMLGMVGTPVVAAGGAPAPADGDATTVVQTTDFQDNETDDNETDTNETDDDTNETDTNETEDGTDGNETSFGDAVSSFVSDLDANNTSSPAGLLVASFVLENNPGNASENVPEWLVNDSVNKTTGPPEDVGPDGNQTGPPEDKGPDSNETGPPEDKGPDSNETGPPEDKGPDEDKKPDANETAGNGNGNGTTDDEEDENEGGGNGKGNGKGNGNGALDVRLGEQ